MYSFDTYFTKWDDHNAAINETNDLLKIGPTVRIKYGDSYKLGFTLYKWELKPSGKMISIHILNKSIPENDEFWSNPSNSSEAKEFYSEMNDIEKNYQIQSINDIIENIENDKDQNVITLKYHASQWRQVVKKKTKWAYLEKAEKTDICNLQRLLN